MRNRSRLRMLRLPVAAFAAAALLVAPGVAAAETVTFLPISAEQIFIVPAGVTSIHAIAVGGRGGDGEGNVGGIGGFGAVATADLAVTPGQTLYIEVGGNGENAFEGGVGGFNGGGSTGDGSPPSAGGGGASDIRLAPAAAGTSLGLRVLVAAGGGGAGSGNELPALTSIDGGTAGAVPTAGTSGNGSGGGEPGSATAGGEGGSGCAFGAAAEAQDGGLGFGGRGSGVSGCLGSPTPGAGGGGGLYGGGGGGASSQASGGGAGSSGFGSIASNGTIATDTTGKPSVSLTYGPSAAPPVGPAPAAKCKVPDLSGRKLKAARKLVRKRGCAVGKVRRKHKHSKKVVAQSPKAGKTVPAGTKISITLGGGKPHRG